MGQAARGADREGGMDGGGLQMREMIAGGKGEVKA